MVLEDHSFGTIWMSIFDLLFIGWFLGSVLYAAWICSLVLRKRWAGARTHSIRWSVMVVFYLALVVLTGILAP